MAYTREQAATELKKARSIIVKNRENTKLVRKYNEANELFRKVNFATQSDLLKRAIEDVTKETDKIVANEKPKRPKAPNRSSTELAREWETKQLKALRNAIKQKDAWLEKNLSDKDIKTLFFNRQLRWDENLIKIVNFDYGKKMINSSNVKITNLVNEAQRDNPIANKVRGQ